MDDASRWIDLLHGYQATCVLVTASRLNLFHRLADEPRSASALADDLGIDRDRLSRFLAALLALDLIEERDGRLHLSAGGRFFLKGDGVGDILTLVDEQYLVAWHQLSKSLTSAEPAFDQIFGMSAWAHRSAEPHLNEAFNRFNQRPQSMAVAAVTTAFDFTPFAQIADLGGGNGYLIDAILRANPKASGILFDQPHVIDQARSLMAARDTAARCTAMAGSFFEEVPSGADLYTLQYILHDWNDEECVTILTNCRRAMKTGARLLILENVLPDSDPPRHLVMRDLHMMTVLGGRERNARQYRALAEAAGLTIDAISLQPAHVPDIIQCSVL